MNIFTSSYSSSTGATVSSLNSHGCNNAAASFDETLQQEVSSSNGNISENNSNKIQNSATPTASQIENFREWKEEYLKGGISEDRRQKVEDHSERFENILNKASSENAYQNPHDFISSLSADELETLQYIHCLADPINPSKLSKEGALNLLNSPGNAQDINHDGIEEIGIAKTIQFPPPDAPAEVKQAWKEAIAGLDKGTVLMMEFSMIPVRISADTLEPQFTYMGANSDYSSLAQQTIERLKISKSYKNLEQQKNTDQVIDGLNRFLESLKSSAPA